MVDVTDTNNTSGQLERERQKLSTADIHAGDCTAIQAFVEHREHVENRSANTLINDLGNLRRAATWADCPLVEMEMSDLRTLLMFMTAPDGRDLDPSGSGMYGYKRALRVFFGWLDDQRDYGNYPFADDIELPSNDMERVDEEELLTADEITALKDAAMNPRDKTLIEFLADTGARKTLASQLRVSDIHDLDTHKPYYTPNPNGEGHKGVENSKRPILQSRADLRTYIHHHHIDARPDAPLWHVDTRWYNKANPTEGAMSGDRIGAMLKECAERAGIDRDRVYPHAFRHVALTRLSNTSRLTSQELMHVAGWDDDRMLDIYDHTSDEERNEGIYEATGFDEADTDSEPSPLQPGQCGNCRADLSAHDAYCPNCGLSIDADTEPPMDRVLLDFAQFVGNEEAHDWMRAKLRGDEPEIDNLGNATDAAIDRLRTDISQ